MEEKVLVIKEVRSKYEAFPLISAFVRKVCTLDLWV